MFNQTPQRELIYDPEWKGMIGYYTCPHCGLRFSRGDQIAKHEPGCPSFGKGSYGCSYTIGNSEIVRFIGKAIYRNNGFGGDPTAPPEEDTITPFLEEVQNKFPEAYWAALDMWSYRTPLDAHHLINFRELRDSFWLSRFRWYRNWWGERVAKGEVPTRAEVIDHVTANFNGLDLEWVRAFAECIEASGLQPPHEWEVLD